MRAFSAWLAMCGGRPVRRMAEYGLFNRERSAADNSHAEPPQRVLIIEDNAENRRKIGMEEG